jgi:hypothetical protein
MHDTAAAAADPSAPRFEGADSPFHELLGLTLVEWRENYARLVCDTGARHANAPASCTAACCSR